MLSDFLNLLTTVKGLNSGIVQAKQGSPTYLGFPTYVFLFTQIGFDPNEMKLHALFAKPSLNIAQLFYDPYG